MNTRRVIFLVFGSLIAVIGFGLVAGGASLGLALSTQSDDDGFFATSNERFESDSFAITSDKIDLGDPGPDDWWADSDLATVRITADNAGSGALFIGIGPEADVEDYLSDVPHDEITDVDYGPFSAKYRPENVDGTSRPTPPEDETFWAAQVAGETTQTLTWNLEPGRWAIVVMNADAAPIVMADIELGGKFGFIAPLAVGLGIGGVILLAIGAALIIGGVIRSQFHAGESVPGSTTGLAGAASGLLHESPLGSSPLRLEGQLNPNLSRWQWLVKWFLSIPHFVILVFLWVAFVVLTIVAFFAIVFTGRYPRSIFEFNVGVLRWTWRVNYYSISAFGTDRYPPFTLEAVDYPARLDIAYPEHLSRGLVLIKSWLLAIPHLFILGVFTATWTFGETSDGARSVLGGGLLGILVAIAAIILLFTGRYPTGLHDLIMGINRWIYRVIVYVALMTDEYPPFRLDQGGREASVLENSLSK
ncbi:MAG: DUF4389 domain-containing protein [Acidimicrobiales bacterium]